MLEDNNIDTIYISSINSAHFKQALKAMDYKKNVICEKPLTTKLEHSLKLINYAKSKDLIIFEAFMFKYHDAFKSIKKIVDSKSSGEIKTLVAQFGIPHLKKNNFRYDNKKGGGSYFDLACYPIKISNLLINENPKSVIIKQNYKNNKIDLSGWTIIDRKSVV